MADHTYIEWTDATWNPITGCTLVSEGCRNCYAAGLAATRLKHHPSRAGLARINAAGEAKFTGEVRLNEQWLDQPLRWRKPRMIFVCAHGDLFHESVPDAWIDRVFAVMALASQHTFQVLTKRPERAKDYLIALTQPRREREIKAAGRKAGALIGDMGLLGRRITALPLPNVWLGTSVEDQPTADARIPPLLATPAAVRFVSAEPLLGPLDLRRWIPGGDDERRHVDWLIVGGESGPRARPMHPDWARSLRDQCAAAGVALFFKQWGEYVPCVSEDVGDRIVCHPEGADSPAFADDRTYPIITAHGHEFWRVGKARAGRLLDGATHNAMPTLPHERTPR